MKTFYFMLVLLFMGLVVSMPSASTMETVANPPRIEPYDNSSAEASGYSTNAVYLGDRAAQVAAVMIGIVAVLAVAYLLTKRTNASTRVSNAFARGKTRIKDTLISSRKKDVTVRMS